MDLDAILRLWDKYIWEAVRYQQEVWELAPERAINLARERVIAGYDTYGDQRLHWPEEDLERERLEEDGDALNYYVFMKGSNYEYS